MRRIVLDTFDRLPVVNIAKFLDVTLTEKIFACRFSWAPGGVVIAKCWGDREYWLWTRWGACPYQAPGHHIICAQKTLYNLLRDALQRGEEVFEFNDMVEFANWVLSLENEK